MKEHKQPSVHHRTKRSAVWLAVGVPTAVMLLAANSAHALSQGSDFNLLYKPAAGGMAGAAYTRPQDVSAAVFGNPATLTQFTGAHFSIGATFLNPTLTNKQSIGGFENTSQSAADNYVIPDVGLSNELAPGWVIGGGLEVNSGLGADYRSDPITLAGGAITVPLIVEFISFNANLALAKQMTPALSLGGALTLGFGLAQLGTTGPTTGISATTGGLFADFGGTSASTHDIAFGGSLGATFQPMPSTTLSVAIKSPLKYHFKNALNGSGVGWQDLIPELPLTVVVGAAQNIGPNFLVEADVIWKNWSSAKVLEDVWDDQFAVALGAQYTMGSWKFRAGYVYQENPLLDDPNGTLGTVQALGSLPLPLPAAVAGAFATTPNALVKLVQTTLVPAIWQNVFTVGASVDITQRTRLDVHAAVAPSRQESRNLGPAFGSFEADLKGYSIGAGLNMKF